MNPTLTIGIPVFNEFTYIGKTIENLFKAISSVKDQIEVIVVDNYSSDGTRDYLESLDIIPKNVKLWKVFNSKNEGFNFSVDSIIAHSKTDYLWIIGGHDQINQEGLKIVLKSLRAKPTYLIGNATIRDETSNSVINESLWGDLVS